jgi:hypothetical protein
MNPRPQTLQEVAAGADSLADFGRALRDWLHTLRRFSSRAQVGAAIRAEPPRLAERFADGVIADAYLAAYAELLAARTRQPQPDWAFEPHRIAPWPWFAEEAPAVRALALAHSPLPFKRRNLFTRAVELPLQLRRGRPWKSAVEKRRANAERQRRFRQRRRGELIQLRALARQPTGQV